MVQTLTRPVCTCTSSDKALWLGGTDVFSEGYWVWSGSKVPIQGFTDWFPGEPNHAGGATAEDCLQLFVVENMQWNDEDCRLNTRFVCEIRYFFFFFQIECAMYTPMLFKIEGICKDIYTAWH